MIPESKRGASRIFGPKPRKDGRKLDSGHGFGLRVGTPRSTVSRLLGS